jgi:hypothetical protein
MSGHCIGRKDDWKKLTICEHGDEFSVPFKERIYVRRNCKIFKNDPVRWS